MKCTTPQNKLTTYSRPMLRFRPKIWSLIIAGLAVISLVDTVRADLEEIRRRGVLRHLGIVYGKFVTGSGDGFDTELIRLFAGQLGLKYEFVQTTWEDAIGDLTGQKVQPVSGEPQFLENVPVRGDIWASGVTVLSWREKVIDFSVPTVPTGIWLVARADSPLEPIKPSGDVHEDIKSVKTAIRQRRVLGIAGTCLDPNLYDLKEAGADLILSQMNPNELAPALVHNYAEACLMEAPEALTALQKWPGKIKAIGPVSPPQEMAYGFSKKCPELQKTFNKFLIQCMKNGIYQSLIKKYFPAIFDYYPGFFENI